MPAWKTTSSVVLHIGPPKTATKSLQIGIIPHLGRPFVVKTGWTKGLARNAAFDAQADIPGDLPKNLVVSDEALGDFKALPPAVIAARLGAVFEGGTVIFVRRDPVARFLSVYRESLLTWLAVFPKALPEIVLPLESPDGFFDYHLGLYRDQGIGLFAGLDTDAISAAFARWFDVRVLEFAALDASPEAFVASFAAACGADAAPELPRLNAMSVERLEQMLGEFPLPLHPDVAARIRRDYTAPSLSRERETLLRGWPSTMREALSHLTASEGLRAAERAARKAAARLTQAKSHA